MSEKEQLVIVAPPQAPVTAPLVPEMRLATKNEFEGSANLCCPSALSCCLSAFFPCAWCCSCFQVVERQESIILAWGQYRGSVREPGCYCMNCCGTSKIEVSTRLVTANLADVKVADKNGNPLNISGIVTFHVKNARKAALEIANGQWAQYVDTQARTVMKQIASMYPFLAPEGQHSLKSEANTIRQEMIRLLQERVESAGVHIVNFELNDLSYAPEIAQAMLIKQQAEALLDARKIIVTGATEIAKDALRHLEKRGQKLEPAEQSRLVRNLLVTICGDAKPNNTKVEVSAPAPDANANFFFGRRFR